MADEEKELDVEVAGQKVRAKGYRLVDLIWLPLVGGVAWTCMTLYQHEAQAQNDKQVMAQAAKEANVAIVNALKENNQNTLEAIKMLASEQKKATNAMREVACLSDPAMKNRQDARDFCKRITRDDR